MTGVTVETEYLWVTLVNGIQFKTGVSFKMKKWTSYFNKEKNAINKSA